MRPFLSSCDILETTSHNHFSADVKSCGDDFILWDTYFKAIFAVQSNIYFLALPSYSVLQMCMKLKLFLWSGGGGETQ